MDGKNSLVQLTVVQAASLTKVSASTVRNWIRARRIPFELSDGVYRINAAGMRSSRVLRGKDLLSRQELRALRIDEADPVRAIEAGAVMQSLGTPACFLLDDADNLMRFKKGEWTPPEPGEPIALAASARADTPDVTSGPPFDAEFLEPVDIDEFAARSGHWEALIDYITGHKDPFKLPPELWDTRTCPEFVPPAGVFHHITWRPCQYENDGGPCTGIKRSQGWWWDPKNRKLYGIAENETHDFVGEILWPPGMEPPEYAVANLRWRTARHDWQAAWCLRRKYLRAQGVDTTTLVDVDTADRRNRRAILERYREEHWSPSDLPDWFWDTDDCPPFEPPTWVVRFGYGEIGPDLNGSGLMGTWIRRSGIWQHPIGDRLYFEPADDHYEWEHGCYREGAVPAEYEEANRDYELAVQEWTAEYAIRQQRRRGED